MIINGSCEVCDASDVQVAPVEFCGRQTFACDKCRADPLRDEMDRDFHRAIAYSRMWDSVIKTIGGA